MFLLIPFIKISLSFGLHVHAENEDEFRGEVSSGIRMGVRGDGRVRSSIRKLYRFHETFFSFGCVRFDGLVFRSIRDAGFGNVVEG